MWLRLGVICLCFINCYAISNDELQDFVNFLKITSNLNNLKSHPAVDFDDDEQITDHAWEDSGKFEGDIILNDRQRRLIIEDVAEGLARNGLKDITKRWPSNEVIFYIQREHFSGGQVQAIEDGISDLQQASCIKFRPYRKGDRDAVVIQGSRRGCFSQVGYQGGFQVLNLSARHPVGRGCFRHGTVVHEMLHTLGFYHMQSSHDRDDYIDVVWDNIARHARHNFRKYNAFAVTDYGVGYDYESVLHYGRRAFSVNGQDTLRPRQNGAEIGQRAGLSEKDTQKLNKMYCDSDSNSDSDDILIRKPIVHKKKVKNQPFKGLGLGYHQGKALIIKLSNENTNPCVNSGKGEGSGHSLSHYLPCQPVFDGFSEQPLIQSHWQFKGYDIVDSLNPVKYNRKIITPKESKSDESLNVRDNISDKNSDSYDETDDRDFNDAFDRLGKIIKNHVYPSQTPNLDVYKKDADFSQFMPSYKSQGSSEDKPNPKSTQKETPADESFKGLEPLDDNSKYSDENPNTHISRNKYESDSSYGTAYPFNKLLKRNEYKIMTVPKYRSPENLEDYSGFIDSTTDSSKLMYEKITDTFENYRDPESDMVKMSEYTKPLEDSTEYDSFEQSDSMEKPSISSNIESENTYDNKINNRSPFADSVSKSEYYIFGDHVPLREKWYQL